MIYEHLKERVCDMHRGKIVRKNLNRIFLSSWYKYRAIEDITG